MKKLLPLIFALLIPFISSAQDSVKTRPNYIRSGFYMKLGPVFPMGEYASGQYVYPFYANGTVYNMLIYNPAKIGAAMDMGMIIYLGPGIANNFLRFGIDATFISIWFNSTTPQNPDNKLEKYYTFAGQKFGPVISINPVSRLIFDISYKLNANFSHHDELDGWYPPVTDSQTSEYGLYILGNEISVSARYSVMVLSFQYNFSSMNYNNMDNNNQDQEIKINTFRLMFGVKF
jgi:hypothetical protein